MFAQGIVAAEQLIAHLAAQYREGARCTGIVRGQEAAAGDIQAEDAGHLRPHAVDHGAAALALVFGFGIALHHRHHVADLRQSLQCLGIVKAQGAYGGDGADRRSLGHGLAGIDFDEVGAELGEFAQYIMADAFADGGKQHHGGDADGDAQSGEAAAQTMRGYRGEGKTQGIGE